MQNEINFRCIILMKVGYHSGESLDEIISRKRGEEHVCGKIFWGYGGTLCHPMKQVTPFIREALDRSTRPMLILAPTSSKLIKPRRVAKEFSTDGKNWTPLPKGVLVTGSRYAIVCKNLKKVNKEINLSKFEVAVGPKKGKNLKEYLHYRIDKACAFISKKSIARKPSILKVTYIAEIVEPYAVFVR